MVVDDFLIPNVHHSVLAALTNTSSDFEISALGMIETRFLLLRLLRPRIQQPRRLM